MRLTLLLGVWFLLLAGQEACYQKAQRIRATVVEKGYRTGTSGVGRGGTGTKSSHWVRYRFTTPSGEQKEQVDNQVLPATWAQLSRGAAVEIQYLAATGDSRVAGQTASSSTLLAIAFGALAAGLLMRRSLRAQRSAQPTSRTTLPNC